MATHLKTQYAQTQADLVEMSLDKDTMKDEYLTRHNLYNTGWYTTDPDGDSTMRRMEKEEIQEAIKCLFQMRPTSRVLEIKPLEGTIHEKTIVAKNTAVFKMTMAEKADIISGEFVKDPRVQGFKYVLEGLDSEKDTPNISISVYTVEETFEVDYIPCSVFVRYRKNF